MPKLAELLDIAEHDVLAYVDAPREDCAKIHSTIPIERLNGEMKRRTNVVGIFPNVCAPEAIKAITRLIGTILLEQSDEWATQRAAASCLAGRRRCPPTAARSARLAQSACADRGHGGVTSGAQTSRSPCGVASAPTTASTP